MIATRTTGLHYIGMVTRFDSKLVAVILLCTAVLLGNQIGGSSANREVSRNGLGGDRRDHFLEEDFWPASLRARPQA